MFLRFIRWAGFVCGIWYKTVNDRMGVRRVGKCPFPPRKFGLRTKYSPKLSRHLKFRLIYLILAMTDFLPAWNSYYSAQVRFTVTMSCSDALAVHSFLWLCLQRLFAKVASGLFCCWSLLRNNTVATNTQKFTLYYVSKGFVAWDCWTHTSWQVM